LVLDADKSCTALFNRPGFSFSGVVKEPTGSGTDLPLPGVAVQVVGTPACSTQTGADGSFSLPCIPYDTNFVLNFSKQGYIRLYSQKFRLTSSLTTWVYHLLPAGSASCAGSQPGKGTIIAEVANLAGSPLAGAVVSASSTMHPGNPSPYPITYGDGFTCGGTSTTASGLVFIGNVDEGDQVTLTATKPGLNFMQAVAPGKADAVTEAAIVESNILKSLEVTMNGTGGGSVNSSPSGLIACTYTSPTRTGTCTANQPEGTPVTLNATRDANSRFVGWGTACSSCGTSVACPVTFDVSKTCSATFTYVKPARIYGSNPLREYDSLQAAYDDPLTLDGAVIQAREFSFIENLNLDKTKNLTIKGGFDPDYNTRPGYSLLKGIMTVGKGSVVTDRLTVK
jgi:hypothetical protein